MTRAYLRGLAVFLIYVLSVVAIVYGINFLFWNYAASKDYLARISLNQNDALFLWGLVLLIFGLLLTFGRGGINLWSVRTAILSSAADSLYGRGGQKTPGPGEIMRRDAWKPSGFVRTGLVLILAGAILILLYLLGCPT